VPTVSLRPQVSADTLAGRTLRSLRVVIRIAVAPLALLVLGMSCGTGTRGGGGSDHTGNSAASSGGSPVPSDRDRALAEAIQAAQQPEVCSMRHELAARPKWPPFPDQWTRVGRALTPTCEGKHRAEHVTVYPLCEAYRVLNLASDNHSGWRAFYDATTNTLIGVLAYGDIVNACEQFGQYPEPAYGSCPHYDLCSGAHRPKR
jgi:hypothetical protein